jgi:hypothetical protein
MEVFSSYSSRVMVSQTFHPRLGLRISVSLPYTILILKIFKGMLKQLKKEIKDIGSSGQHRKTTRPRLAVEEVVPPPHDVEHVPGKSKVHPYGRAVQVQAAGISEDNPAMSNDTVVAY